MSMSDLQDRVRRELEQLHPSSDALERTLNRVSRRRRTRHATAGALGVLLTAALVAGLLVVPRPTPRPTGGGVTGRIAFSRGLSNGGIYAMNPDGSGLIRLTSDVGDDQAAWSPD